MYFGVLLFRDKAVIHQQWRLFLALYKIWRKPAQFRGRGAGTWPDLEGRHLRSVRNITSTPSKLATWNVASKAAYGAYASCTWCTHSSHRLSSCGQIPYSFMSGSSTETHVEYGATNTNEGGSLRVEEGSRVSTDRLVGDVLA